MICKAGGRRQYLQASLQAGLYLTDAFKGTREVLASKCDYLVRPRVFQHPTHPERKPRPHLHAAESTPTAGGIYPARA